MKTGFGGVSAILWSQTEIDELEAAPPASLAVGAAWSWRGRAIQLNHPAELERNGCRSGWDMFGDTEGRDALLSVIRECRATGAVGYSLQSVDASITITNGARSYTMLMVETQQYVEPMLVFGGELPPKGQDFWVSGITWFSAGELDVARSENAGVTYLSASRIGTVAQDDQKIDPVSRPIPG